MIIVLPKVALIEAKSSFQDYRIAKTQFYVYIYNLYKNLIKLDRHIEPIEVNISAKLGKGLSIILDSFNRNFSRYDVIHSLDLNPFFPIRRGNALHYWQ